MTDKNVRPFLSGPPTTFSGKYPQIKTIRIDYEQTEDRIDQDRWKGSMSESSMSPTVSCGWDRCHEGGFQIEDQIYMMVSSRQEVREGELRCSGHERLSGKKKGYHCCNTLKYKAQITYHDQTPQP